MRSLYLVFKMAASLLYIVLTHSCRQSPLYVSGGSIGAEKQPANRPLMVGTPLWICALNMEKNRPRYFPVRCRRNISVTFLS